MQALEAKRATRRPRTAAGRRTLRPGQGALGRPPAQAVPPITEEAANQHVFELEDVEGTVVGFRFPDYAKGMNVPGYHLHFVTADRLAAATSSVQSGRRHRPVDDRSTSTSSCPPGVELHSPDATSDTEAAVQRVEHEG